MSKKVVVYWKFAGKPPLKNTILTQGNGSGLWKVKTACCTDPWWKKFLRKMGFKVANYAGLTKCVLYKATEPW